MDKETAQKTLPGLVRRQVSKNVIKYCLTMGILSFIGAIFSCSDKKPGTLSASGYYFYEGKWHYYGGFSNASHLELDGADSATFEKLNGMFPENTYARDKNKAYYNGKTIPGAVGRSFSRIKSYLSKDDRHVYYMSSVLSDDPKNFVLVDEHVTKDSRQVYWEDRPISRDPSNFRLVGTSQGLSYYADRDGVIANSTRIPGADPASFKVLSHGYSLDQSGVFLMQATQAEKITGADPATFNVLSAYYTADAKQVFWNGRALEGADPSSFRILNEEIHCSSDKKQAYHHNKVIPNADPAKFPDGKPCKYCTDEKIVFNE